MKNKLPLALLCATACTLGLLAHADDWLQWGRDPSKNMAGQATNIPVDFSPGTLSNDKVDPKTTKHIKWIAKLGSQAYGNATVGGGRVFIGTNNNSPRDPKYKGDRSCVFALDEKTGKLLWQLVVPKLGAGKVSDWEYLGMCSSPTIEGDRVYIVTNRCEVLCLDVKGLANGNDGPFKDEARYLGSKGKSVKLGPLDADIIWRYDMRKDVGAFPHNVTSSSALLAGDYLYINTSNGVDWSHVNIPSPRTPALIVLDKKTGKLAGEEVSGISKRLMHGSWSSPSYGVVDGRELVFFGGGDGWCYAFDAKPVKRGRYMVLNEVWRFDCNPPAYRFKNGTDGAKIKYATAKGPSEIIATPVFYKNRVYISIGQDPEHGKGLGQLICIDASKKGDISKTGAIWSYKKIDRSISTVAIAGGLVFAADYAGTLHCLDAEKGTAFWTHDTGGNIWGSPLAADGKVFIGNEEGLLTILAATRKKKLLGQAEFDVEIYSSPIVANGVLYVSTQSHLFAVSKK